MKIGDFDLTRKVMIIAEIGNNHEGDYALAEEMLGLAAQAGADAVKFQTIIPERLVSATQPERIEQLRRFQLSYHDFTKLASLAEKCGVMFLSTPFDMESALFLNDLVPAYKIASGDNNFYPLLETVARTGKPIIISSGLADIEMLKYSTAYIRKIWTEQDIMQDLAVLHCVTSYPVPPEEANLNSISYIRESLGCTVGYSDHTLGIEAPVIAVAVGARIIEKHFTIDHNYSEFRDHQLSANPFQLKEMVYRIREAETLLGAYQKKVHSCEKSGMLASRRSIAAARDLEVEHILRMEDISWIRPGSGIAPGEEAMVLGKKCRVPFKAGEFISLEKVH